MKITCKLNLIAIAFFGALAITTTIVHAADSLPSWNDGAAKKSVVEFVEKVTKEGGSDFVPPAERIAVFDNDGTLWAEQPLPVQLYFALDRVKALRHIGRLPIAAFGNSVGDQQMLQWTTAGSGARFALIVHHTDTEREWAYDRASHIGQLDKVWDEAKAKNWTIVDMKQDWKTIFRPKTSES
jgi:hypothetical protein